MFGSRRVYLMGPCRRVDVGAPLIGALTLNIGGTLNPMRPLAHAMHTAAGLKLPIDREVHNAIRLLLKHAA